MADSFPSFAREVVISRAILASSQITRLGLACPGKGVQERAADDLAELIADALATSESQLALAL